VVVESVWLWGQAWFIGGPEKVQLNFGVGLVGVGDIATDVFTKAIDHFQKHIFFD